MTAIQQLEHWKLFRENWCDHNPSITVYVGEKEWPGVGGWVWDHFDGIGGLTFLPRSEHSYKQAPYEEISGERYQQLLEAQPEADWRSISEYETGDHTTAHLAQFETDRFREKRYTKQ